MSGGGKKRAAPDAPFMGTPAEIEECLKKVSHPRPPSPRPSPFPALRVGLRHASPAIYGTRRQCGVAWSAGNVTEAWGTCSERGW